MVVNGDATPVEKQETLDLNQRQDDIIKEIREKEKAGVIKRIVALLRYFFKRDYLL